MRSRHGRGWRNKCGSVALVGAALEMRALLDTHAWVEAHRKKD